MISRIRIQNGIKAGEILGDNGFPTLKDEHPLFKMERCSLQDELQVRLSFKFEVEVFKTKLSARDSVFKAPVLNHIVDQSSKSLNQWIGNTNENKIILCNES